MIEKLDNINQIDFKELQLVRKRIMYEWGKQPDKHVVFFSLGNKTLVEINKTYKSLRVIPEHITFEDYLLYTEKYPYKRSKYLKNGTFEEVIGHEHRYWDKFDKRIKKLKKGVKK